MEVEIFSNYRKSMNETPIELVERKGIGHPDTLADMIADNFSNKYSRFCLEKFGVIPHHWADKVTLVGAKADIGYGYSKLIRPIKAFQFGRVTPDIGDVGISVDKLFQESVYEVMSRVFSNINLDGVIDCGMMIHDGAGPDHPKEFYNPQSAKDIGATQEEPKSNDTVIIASYAGYSNLEQMIIELENCLNSTRFKSKYPETGYDVKVLAARNKNKVDVTVCIPFIAEKTPNFKTYKNILSSIYEDINNLLNELYPQYSSSLHLNTKDFGEHAYLTMFGTSLDKGGCGAVGRGNRFNGLITPTREMNIEASSGKNPTHHAGRLYSEAVFCTSRDIFLQYNIENYLNLVARNGDDLDNPAFIFVKCIDNVLGKDEQIRNIVASNMEHVSSLTKEIIFIDPVKNHIERPRQLYSAERWLSYEI